MRFAGSWYSGHGPRKKQLSAWWGPHRFTNPVCEMDLRPGGRIRIDMRAPDGAVFRMGGCFHEINSPERLVFTSTAFEDEEGLIELENLNTVLFFLSNREKPCLSYRRLL